MLSVEGLRSKHVGPVGFTLHAGEVLGLVGLRSAGHDVVGRMIAGAIRGRGGSVDLDGRRRNMDDIWFNFVKLRRGSEPRVIIQAR